MTSAKFRPTPAMQNFLEAALDANTPAKIRFIALKAGVHESSWRHWKRNPAFLRWYSEQWQHQAATRRWLLDKIGFQKAPTDFRYWQAMQEKFSDSPPGLRHPQLTVIIRAPRPDQNKPIL